MREVGSRILRNQALGLTCRWALVLEVLLSDIEEITDGPETFYACQKLFLCGRTIELSTFKWIFPWFGIVEEINILIVVALVLPLTIYFEQSRLNYISYIVFGAWLFLFGILFMFIFYSFLLPVLCSINKFHIIPCLWKNFDDNAVISLELSYDLERRSSCDLYFIIEEKRAFLNSTLRNELKKKKTLKVMAINDGYFCCFIFATVALITYVFSPFAVINPYLVGGFVREGGPPVAVLLTGIIAFCKWYAQYYIMIFLLLLGKTLPWTRGLLKSKIRSLELDQEVPMVRV
jgi:hypothetical protein